MDGSLVTCTIEDHIAIVTIDHPPMNTLDVATKESLGRVFQELDDRRGEIRVVVLHGAGEKAFAAGADIKSFLDLKPDTAQRRLARSHQIYEMVENFEWPVIAAINGYCLGAGLELSLCCDIRYAAQGARLGFPEVNLSLFPGNGGTQRVLYHLTLGKAKELIYTGKILDSRTALQYGLVERVVPDNQLMDEVLGLANQIKDKGPLGVAAAKKALNRSRDLFLAEGLKLESDLWSRLTDSEDAKEGARAFLEKRKPIFKCR